MLILLHDYRGVWPHKKSREYRTLDDALRSVDPDMTVYWDRYLGHVQDLPPVSRVSVFGDCVEVSFGDGGFVRYIFFARVWQCIRTVSPQLMQVPSKEIIAV